MPISTSMQVHTKYTTKILPFCHSEDETVDPFESAAATFNPVSIMMLQMTILRWIYLIVQLYNAMLAVSALSLSIRERLGRVDSLQYYQKAIEGLRQQKTLESINMVS